MAEKKYIELQKALNICEMHYEHCLEMHDWSGDATADNIKRDIETIPAADVVEVVRCKDCTEWDKNECECSHWYGFKENDFCSHGTPKERGEEK